MSVPDTDQPSKQVGLLGRYGRLLHWVAVGCALLTAHAVIVARFGAHERGPFFSAFLLLAEGIACAIAATALAAGPVRSAAIFGS